MPSRKIAITMDAGILEEVDRLVLEKTFPNRSRAIQQAVAASLERLGKRRLLRECRKLDPKQERLEAEMGLTEDSKEWPEY
jgi:metal-responsive CopG/Arc/MetJ family transcriptional regulator